MTNVCAPIVCRLMWMQAGDHMSSSGEVKLRHHPYQNYCQPDLETMMKGIVAVL